MANVNLKTDFKNGEKLFDHQLNNNFAAIQAALAAMNKIVWQDEQEVPDSILAFRGTTEELRNREIIDGQLLYDVNTGESYIDYEGRRISTGGGNAIYIGEDTPNNPSTQIWINPSESVDIETNIKYRDKETGEFKDAYSKSGDTLPVGTVVDYDGEEIPSGWEEVDYTDNIYSTEEKIVGTWIDGKRIYRKVLSFSASDFTYNTMHFNHNISNIDNIVTQKCNWYDSAADRWRTVPSSYYGSLEWSAQFGTSASQITFELGNAALTRVRESATKIFVTLEYTKTTDVQEVPE